MTAMVTTPADGPFDDPVAAGRFRKAFIPRQACGNPYNPFVPHPKQQAMMLLEDWREILFGGAAGPGKTVGLMMAALQYMCVPGYAAVLFRRTSPQLHMESGLVDLSLEFLAQTDAEWDATYLRWTFPSGATLSLAHAERDADRFKFQGSEFHFVGFDELTHWPNDKVYRYLFSRTRRPDRSVALKPCPKCGFTAADVPLRNRAASNPGGPGGQWVYDRFVRPWLERDQTRELRPDDGMPLFIPARLRDNPSLDFDSYVESLGQLDPITRAQLLDGDWDVRESGGMFERQWFTVVEDWPRDARLCRYWDLAHSDEKPGTDPDWTVGVLMAAKDGIYWVVDVRRVRRNPGEIEKLVKATALVDHQMYGRIAIRMEQEPSSGKKTIQDYSRKVLSGFDFDGRPAQGSKPDRARGFSAAAANDNVRVVAGSWNVAWLDELEAFPQDGFHDDQVDASSGAFNELAGLGVSARGGLRR